MHVRLYISIVEVSLLLSLCSLSTLSLSLPPSALCALTRPRAPALPSPWQSYGSAIHACGRAHAESLPLRPPAPAPCLLWCTCRHHLYADIMDRRSQPKGSVAWCLLVLGTAKHRTSAAPAPRSPQTAARALRLIITQTQLWPVGQLCHADNSVTSHPPLLPSICSRAHADGGCFAPHLAWGGGEAKQSHQCPLGGCAVQSPPALCSLLTCTLLMTSSHSSRPSSVRCKVLTTWQRKS